jgi:hypothetical protein
MPSFALKDSYFYTNMDLSIDKQYLLEFGSDSAVSIQRLNNQSL